MQAGVDEQPRPTFELRPTFQDYRSRNYRFHFAQITTYLVYNIEKAQISLSEILISSTINIQSRGC